MAPRIRTAFVLGAGLGTRLRPLTNALPKPLIPIANKPLITYAFDHLLAAGIQRFIVNTHHCAEAYRIAFPAKKYRGAPIAFRHEPDVLETAGGIKNVEDLLGSDPFLVYNGDILTDLPLDKAMHAHADLGNEVTLVLRAKDGPLQIAFDAQRQRITGIGQEVVREGDAQFLFTGVYVVSPEFLDRIAPREKIGVVPVFKEMIRAGERLGGVVLNEGWWWDLGTREQYLAAHRHLAAAAPSPDWTRIGSAPWISATAVVHPTAVISGATAIGEHVKVQECAHLHDCVVWQGAEIASATVLERCVVTAGRHVSQTCADADF